MVAYANVSFDDHLIGYVGEPNGRGTFTIVWSCLAVLLLNTWTVLHLNIPHPKWRSWRIYMHKAKWAFVALLIPEGIMTVAFNQRRNAKSSIKYMKKYAPQWTLMHGFYSEMGGFKVRDESTETLYTFRAVQLHWLAENGIIGIPPISKKEIHDRSKASRVAKALACLQSAWFLLSSLARVVQHLPLTTFEVATIPFIGITWVTYYLWWDKPVDMETFTTIHLPSLPTEDLCRMAQDTCFSKASGSWYRPALKETSTRGWDFYWFEKSMDFRHLSIVRSNHLLPQELREMVKHSYAEARVCSWFLPAINEFQAAEWNNINDITLVLAGWFFNGLHLVAWHNVFPTEVESLLWKISVCLMLGYIALSGPCAMLLYWLPEGSFMKDLPIWCITVCYAVTRFYLIVEVFIGLRAVPPAVYRSVDWSQYIPNID
ncbi:MAG: hypothetical protein Q9167_006631 [Letrouitia subvulpina]